MAPDSLSLKRHCRGGPHRRLPKGNLLVGHKVEVRRLGEGFESSRTWDLGTVSGWRGSVRRVEYGNRVVQLIDISNNIGEEDSKIGTERFRGLIRPAMDSPPLGVVDKWSLNYGLCVDAFVNGSWCEGVVVDQELGFDERLIFFPDSGNQKATSIEELRITRDWNQGSERWESRGNWLFLETIEEYGLGSLLGNVSMKQIWHNVRDREEFHDKRLVDWTCKDRVFWDSLARGVIRDTGLASKQVFTGDIDTTDDTLRELTTKRRKTNDSQFLPGGAVLDEFDEGIQCTKVDDQNLMNGQGKEFFMVEDIGNNHGGGNDFMCVEEDDKEVDSQHDRTNGDSGSNHSTLSEPDGSQHDITSGDSSSDDSTCSAPKRIGARKREVQWRPAGKDIIAGAKRIPEALVNYYYAACSKHGQPRNTKNALQKKARMHLLYMGWRIEFTNKGKITRFRYTSPDGEAEYSLVKICERLMKHKREVWKEVIEKGHKNMDNVPAELANSSVFQEVVRRSLKSSEIREVENPSKASPKHRKTPVSSVPKAEVLDAYSGKFCPEAVILWNEIGSDREKRKQLKQIEKDTPDKAKNHLLAVGWKLWYKDKGSRQELRYTSPNGKNYISLVQACKACVEEGNLCMINTGLQNGILDEKLMKSLGVADKLTPPTSKCCEGNLCTNTGSQSVILDDEELKTLGNADKLSPPTSKCSEGDDGNRLPKNEQSDKSVLPEHTQSQESVGSQINQEEAVVAADSNAINGLVEEEEAVTIDYNASSGMVEEVEGHQVNSGIRTSALQSTKTTRQVLKPRQPKRKCILSILVDNNVVALEDYVFYRGKTENKRRMAEGRITHEGIRCNCCQMIFGLSAFEAHAGSTNHRPAANIFLEDGRSLVDCQRQLTDQAGGAKSSKTTSHDQRNNTNSNKMNNQSDQICCVCQYGGTLLLCENCPSAFHLNCIGLKDLPEGDWFCPSCRCGECRRVEFNGEVVQLHDKSVISCHQCERKYHIGCPRLRGRMELEQEGGLKGSWFCSEECEQIFIGLHNILGQSISLDVDGLSWTILKPPKVGRPRKGSLPESGGPLKGHRRKLKFAVEVMHECFEPVNDPGSGTDIVQDVIFNKRSDLNRLNFSGFYTLLLEREDEIIAVAAVRIYGDKVAEVPLVGTRFQYRRQGMCRILFNALEKKLMELGVERLVLPAAEEVVKTWTGSFGFSEMTEAERLMFLEYTFMEFQGTTMCQKLLRN